MLDKLFDPIGIAYFDGEHGENEPGQAFADAQDSFVLVSSDADFANYAQNREMEKDINPLPFFGAVARLLSGMSPPGFHFGNSLVFIHWNGHSSGSLPWRLWSPYSLAR